MENDEMAQLAAKALLREWVNSTVEDIKEALKGKSVLALPYLSDVAVFLIQETVKENFPTFVSFNVGPEYSKRIIICEQRLLKSKVMSEHQILDAPLTVCKLPDTNEECKIADLTLPLKLTEDNKIVVPTDSCVPEESSSGSVDNMLPKIESHIESPSSVKKKRPEREFYIPRMRQQKKFTQNPNELNFSPQADVKTLKISGSANNLVESSHCLLQPEPDDHWDCLGQEHLDELEYVAGSVEIMKPGINMMNYEVLIFLEDPSLGHIIEAYDFPEKFKSVDIQRILIGFSNYHISWVNLTCALLLFRDTKSASEVLTLRHPSIKLRPMSIASPAARTKAKDSAVRPYKERPATIPTVAKRLISSSLGIKPVKTDATIAEDNFLREAREKKKLLREQQRKAES